MKKVGRFLALVLTLVLLLGCVDTLAPAAVAEENKIQLSVLCQRNNTAVPTDVNTLWCFRHLEEKFNVDLVLEQTLEPETRISLMFGSNTMPDIIYGIGISPADIMMYGVEEGMILKWNDLISSEKTPNIYQAMQDYPEAFTASLAPDNNLYGLPNIGSRTYYSNKGAFGGSVRIYANTDWMKACNVEKPTTLDEFIDMLRTFKKVDPMNLGERNIPLLGNAKKDMDYVWASLGFYGADRQDYGTGFSIKDGQIQLPCYTEEGKYFLEVFNTMYKEGLLSPDFFTLDTTTTRGLISSGYCGVFGDYTLVALGEAFQQWDALPALTSKYNDTAINYSRPTYMANISYASSTTKYPELVAQIFDYCFSPEGAALLSNGPHIDHQDTYGLVEPWWYDENGERTNAAVQRGEYNDYGSYASDHVTPYTYPAGAPNGGEYWDALLGPVGEPDEIVYITDCLTGKQMLTYRDPSIDPNTSTGHWNLIQSEAMKDHIVDIQLPTVFMSADDSVRAADLKTVIDDYVIAESAKFIAGTRPLEELDQYFEELKSIGIEEYIELYRTAYAPFISNTFGD